MIAEGNRAPDFILPGSGKSGNDVFDLEESLESHNLLLMFCSSDILEEPMNYRPLEFAPWFQLFKDMNVWIVADSGLSSEVNQTIFPLNRIPILIDRHNHVANQYGIRSDDHLLNESPIAVVIVDESKTVRLSHICKSGTISKIKQVLQDTELSTPYSNMKA